jgi:glycosyltransferase involved in cell wall biosynthesis
LRTDGAGTLSALSAPTVSVIVPTHNRHREVRRAVASVLSQSFADWELVIVDDGSRIPVDPDALGTDDDRVTLLRHEAPRGVSEARNTGIRQARGQWIALLDDDDMWSPDKLELQLACLREHDARWSFTSYVKVSEDGRPWWTFQAVPMHDTVRELLFANVVGVPATVMIAADLLEEVGPFSSDLQVLADWDMWIRLSSIGAPAALSAVAAAILEHPGNMQVVELDQIRTELERLRVRHADLIQRYGVRFPSSEMYIWMAKLRWRSERSVRARLGFGWTAARHGQYGRAHEVIPHRLRRLRHQGAEPRAPEWVDHLLGVAGAAERA